MDIKKFYKFDDIWKDYIKGNIKKQTLRKGLPKSHIQPGEIFSLVDNLLTPICEDKKCCKLSTVNIKPHCKTSTFDVFVDNALVDKGEFAISHGFTSFDEMKNYFSNKGWKFPFKGTLIIWE